ncbi:MAG: hypothetical protein HQL82_04225 [Magnetococcales bacterium]|nr:hypothetical protein [Magnetococcales bacterium]
MTIRPDQYYYDVDERSRGSGPFGSRRKLTSFEIEALKNLDEWPNMTALQGGREEKTTDLDERAQPEVNSGDDQVGLGRMGTPEYHKRLHQDVVDAFRKHGALPEELEESPDGDTLGLASQGPGMKQSRPGATGGSQQLAFLGQLIKPSSPVYKSTAEVALDAANQAAHSIRRVTKPGAELAGNREKTIAWQGAKESTQGKKPMIGSIFRNALTFAVPEHHRKDVLDGINGYNALSICGIDNEECWRDIFKSGR